MDKIVRSIVIALGAMTISFGQPAIALDFPSPPGVGTPVPAPTYTFSLKPGWNLIGHSVTATSNLIVRDMLSGKTPDNSQYMIISAFKYLSPLENNGIQSWYYFGPAFDANILPSKAQANGYLPLLTIKPGEGFWVNVRDIRANPATDPVVPYTVSQ